MTIIADFKEVLRKGVTTLLKNPAFFGQVQVGNKGRSNVWREQDIDLCVIAYDYSYIKLKKNVILS